MRRGDENIHHSTHSIKRRRFDHLYYWIYNSKSVNDYKTPSADIQKMLDITRNQKHKTILSILYGCGLRRNEIIELKLQDIDLNAKTITVHG